MPYIVRLWRNRENEMKSVPFVDLGLRDGPPSRKSRGEEAAAFRRRCCPSTSRATTGEKDLTFLSEPEQEKRVRSGRVVRSRTHSIVESGAHVGIIWAFKTNRIPSQEYILKFHLSDGVPPLPHFSFFYFFYREILSYKPTVVAQWAKESTPQEVKRFCIQHLPTFVGHLP